MNRKEWERRFLKCLKPLSKREKEEALAYYREMYGDKLDAGLSERDIIREFGFPEDCAERILAENYPERDYSQNGKVQRTPERAFGGFSIAEGIGLFFISLILILPLAIVALVLIIVFGAVSLVGAVLGIAGVVYAVIAPFVSIGTLSAAGCFGNLGVGLTLCGVGLLLFVLFSLLTKYLALGTGKALARIYRRN